MKILIYTLINTHRKRLQKYRERERERKGKRKRKKKKRENLGNNKIGHVV